MDLTEIALAQLDAVLQEYRDAVARSQYDDLSDLGTELDALGHPGHCGSRTLGSAGEFLRQGDRSRQEAVDELLTSALAIRYRSDRSASG